MSECNHLLQRSGATTIALEREFACHKPSTIGVGLWWGRVSRRDNENPCHHLHYSSAHTEIVFEALGFPTSINHIICRHLNDKSVAPIRFTQDLYPATRISLRATSGLSPKNVTNNCILMENHGGMNKLVRSDNRILRNLYFEGLVLSARNQDNKRFCYCPVTLLPAAFSA